MNTYIDEFLDLKGFMNKRNEEFIMSESIKFSEVMTNDVKVGKNLKFDLSQFRGAPKKGLRLLEVTKKPYGEYENGHLKKESVDPSRTVKLIFKAYDLKKVLREVSDFEDGEIDQDEYEDNIAGLPVITLSIENEQDCSEFLNEYGAMVEELENGIKYDSPNANIAIVPKWGNDFNGNGAFRNLGITFDGFESLKFSKVKPPKAPKA